MKPKLTIRALQNEDADYVLAMMLDFYMSPAVIHKPDIETLKRNIEACLSEDQPVIGYVFLVDDTIVGYSMVAKSFSTEYGVPCIWIEDLYIKPKYRHRGIGQTYVQFITNEYPVDKYRVRLEVEINNESAKRFYDNAGMTDILYLQKEFKMK